MQEVRYIRPIPILTKTVLKKNHIYRVNQINKYQYEILSRDYDVIICVISSKVLNYCFEEIKERF